MQTKLFSDGLFDKVRYQYAVADLLKQEALIEHLKNRIRTYKGHLTRKKKTT